MYLISLLCIISLASGQLLNNQPSLSLVNFWSNLEFGFPTQQARTQAVNEGKYVVGNSIPIDVDVYYPQTSGQAKVFITLPRFMTGTPITLGTVSGNRGSGGPKIQAYPNYASQSSHGQNCDGITSVFRVKIDECHRLWVLDSGAIGTTQYCQPQILVYDLKTDALLSRYRFPKDQYQDVSLFITPAVDVRNPPPGNCENTMVYIADVTGFGLVVYDHRRKTSWRIKNKLFFSDPDFGTHTINGESFDLMDGIMGLAVTPVSASTNQQSQIVFPSYGNRSPLTSSSSSGRRLYFQALASDTLNSVSLSLLDNQTIWTSNAEAEPGSFITLGHRQTQSGPLAIDRAGNLFFGASPTTLACWSPNSSNYSPATIRKLMNSPETLQFVSGIKVIRNLQNIEELWVVTNRLQKFYTGTMDFNQTNFRIQAVRVDQLVNSRGCIGTMLF